MSKYEERNSKINKRWGLLYFGVKPFSDFVLHISNFIFGDELQRIVCKQSNNR
jgi:hypothetical protein